VIEGGETVLSQQYAYLLYKYIEMYTHTHARTHARTHAHTHTHTHTHTLNPAACGTGRWTNIFTTFCMQLKEVNFHTKSARKLCAQSVNSLAFNFNSDPTSPPKPAWYMCYCEVNGSHSSSHLHYG